MSKCYLFFLHQSIDILAQLLVKIESNPFKSRLVRSIFASSTSIAHVTRFEVHPCTKFPSVWLHISRTSRSASERTPSVLSTLTWRSASQKSSCSLIQVSRVLLATQAIDMIQGGVKANALPEQVWVVINHRISTERYVIITI